MMVMGDTIDHADLPALGNGRTGHGSQASLESAPESLQEHERLLVIRALEKAGGNQTQAARSLRIKRDALRYKMKKFQLL